MWTGVRAHIELLEKFRVERHVIVGCRLFIHLTLLLFVFLIGWLLVRGLLLLRRLLGVLDDVGSEARPGIISGLNLLLLLLLSDHLEFTGGWDIFSLQYPLLLILCPLGLPGLEGTKLFGQRRELIIVYDVLAGTCLGLQMSILLGEGWELIIIDDVFIIFAIQILSPSEIGPELLRKRRQFVVVDETGLFTWLEVLERLELILGQILFILLAKCTKLVIIQGISLLLLWFEWTLTG